MCIHMHHVMFATHCDLPERHKHHHFDTKEFAHWFDWTELLPQGPVEQHQAVHGKLEEQNTNKEKSCSRQADCNTLSIGGHKPNQRHQYQL